MEILIASDHAGFQHKKNLVEFLSEKYTVIDLGCFSSESCDYPDFAHELTQELTQKPNAKGILVCGTGIGMSMAANKHSNIRAALCTNSEMAQLAREHNNANVLCLGAKTTPLELAKQITQTFLETPFSEEPRHQQRIQKIDFSHKPSK